MRSDNKYNPLMPTGPTIPPVVKDRLNRPLLPGDLAFLDFPNMQRPVFEIVAITPLLDPKAPPGMMKIECRQMFTVMGQAGGAAQEITRVAEAREITRVEPSVPAAVDEAPKVELPVEEPPAAPDDPRGPRLVEN